MDGVRPMKESNIGKRKIAGETSGVSKEPLESLEEMTPVESKVFVKLLILSRSNYQAKLKISLWPCINKFRTEFVYC